MNIGFIGAGKVGFSLGKFLSDRGTKVTGYYSHNPNSSEEAAKYTNTRQYLNLRSLVEDSDCLFLTVPDGVIASVWELLKMLPIQDKMICHCSGSLSSSIFSEIERYRAYGYSIHPLIAVNDKYNSHKDFASAFFTMEGHPKYLKQLRHHFEQFGNTVEVISATDKTRYHAVAAMASNLYVGLVHLCEELLCDCGFTAKNAHKALSPLIMGNTENVVNYGPIRALTGPIERNDVATVCNHMDNLDGDAKAVYQLLSKQVLEVAKIKHPERDYGLLEGELKK